MPKKFSIMERKKILEWLFLNPFVKPFDLLKTSINASFGEETSQKWQESALFVWLQNSDGVDFDVTKIVFWYVLGVKR